MLAIASPTSRLARLRKVGQALSIRTDLLPAPYVKGLVKLQDAVPPFPAAQVSALELTPSRACQNLRIDACRSSRRRRSARLGSTGYCSDKGPRDTARVGSSCDG